MSDIKADPFVVNLLNKLPADARGTFSDEQLLALKVGLGGRAWGTHALDLRWTMRLWRWHYYFVVLAGRNKRELTRRDRLISLYAMALMLAFFLILATGFGVLVLYLIKSALGIDLIPGFSFGVWGWFKGEFN